MDEKIVELEIYTISKGFYQVRAITDEEKISCEGEICGGILKRLINEVKQNKGEVRRYKTPLFFLENYSEVQQLKAELKKAYQNINKIRLIIKKC